MMLIIKNEDDKQACTSPWGNNTLHLTKEEIMALLVGETLGDPNFYEYGLFIKMED